MEVDSLKQLREWQPPDDYSIIGGGILLPKTRLIIYGQWKSFKSMLAQELAFCLATGKKWAGFGTRQSIVYLVQLEIPRAMFRKRVIKYADAHKLDPTNLWFTSQPYLKLDREYGYNELERAVSWCHPQVVIIDPLYKVLSGNISDSYDMSKLLDNLDRLMDRQNVSIVLISHTRKPRETESGDIVDRGSEEMMGSSFLPNWCDSAIGIKVVGTDLIRLEFTAMRHAEEEIHPLTLRFNRTTLGFSAMRLVP